MGESLLEKARRKIKEQEKKKEALSHPPMAPKLEELAKLKPPPKSILKKPPSREIPEIEPLEEEFFIDFDKIANLSSFQRWVVEAIKISVPQLSGVSARLSKEGVKKAYNQKIKEIDKAVVMYNEIQRLDSKQLKEIRSHPLFLSQKDKNNPQNEGKVEIIIDPDGESVFSESNNNNEKMS